jgi:ElaB/YqjD/DUF883 family membrane-anchored ribosome-binding protein
MADQRTGDNAEQSPAEASAQVRDKAQAMVRQGAETASDYYQQGRQQVEAVQHTLEDSIRAKPLQAILMSAGMGMLLTLLWKKEETASDYYQRGRRQVEALQNTFADTMRAKPWRSYYRKGRQQVQDAEHTLTDTVRAKPWQALLMAVGAGIVLGGLMKK